MTQLTTYTVKSRSSSHIWQFKYDLNGDFVEFKILDGELTPAQMVWLAKSLPYFEDWIKDWQDLLADKFEITAGEPDLSFEALWALWDDKRAKQDAIKSFKKLKPGEVIKVFKAVPHYKAYLATSTVGALHLATFINKGRYNDEWPVKIPKKIDNPLLAQLAKQKTDK